jgi:hypothetical protein
MERRPYVEAGMSVVIAQVRYLSVAVEETGRHIRLVALLVYAFVPVVIRLCCRVFQNRIKPRIFTGGLIKMRMDTNSVQRVQLLHLQ